MNNSLSKKMRKIISSTCAILLIFGLVSSSFTKTVSAETNQYTHTILLNDYNIENDLNSIFKEKEEIILSQEILDLEDKISDYLDEIPYTEDEFEAMSDEDFDRVYNTYFSSEEFLSLEKEYTETFEAFEARQMGMQPMIIPLLVPIVAAVARVALQTVVKQGSRIASTYLKKNLKSLNKNYSLTWNVKGSDGRVRSLLVITHKPTKQQVFRLDNGTLPLKPGSSDWYWHYHIGGSPVLMKHHYSIRAFIPSKHQPQSTLTLY